MKPIISAIVFVIFALLWMAALLESIAHAKWFSKSPHHV